MLKFQLLLPQDIKEVAAVERRRRNEEERKKRIFNARKRLIGVDIEALEKQVEERKIRDLEQKQLDEIFGEQQNRNAQLAMALEKKEREERKRMDQEISLFRQKFQKFEDRREYDLNDPHIVRNSLPTRMGDDDPRFGLSAAQKFEGEDIAGDARKKIQIEQTKAYLEQQIKELKAAEQERKDAEELYQAAIVARDNRAVELDNLEKECRKKLDAAVVRFNQSLAEQQLFEKDIKKQQELEDNFAEMYNAVTGDLLTENPKQSQSSLGPKRAIGYMYKGMTPEERAVYRKDQLLQIEANKVKRQEAMQIDKYWDEYGKYTSLELAKMDMDIRTKQTELKKQIAEYNKSLAEEHKAYQDYLRREVYTNKLSPEYYNQFNTSTR